MTKLLFALRLFRRDFHNPELRLLALALMVAVSAVTAVSFFTDRVEQAMELQAGEILAADLVLSSSESIPSGLVTRAEQAGLLTSLTLQFPSVVLHGDKTQLVQVKAVDPNYPLRGRLTIRQQRSGQEQPAEGPPDAGRIWAQARLLATLGLVKGDRLSLGEAEFRIAAIISRDPADAASLFRLGPGLLMTLRDIPATGLVTPASRVRHQLLVAGPKPAVARYHEWAKSHLPPGVSLHHMSNARPELRTALQRANRFLGLAALAAVLMASAAVALASRRFVERQSDTTAILRCFGASRRMLLQLLLLRLLFLALAASLLGSLLGYGLQSLLAGLVGDWFDTGLPLPGLSAFAIGTGVGLVTLFGFTLPPMLRLADVPPLRVLRRELPAPPASAWLLGGSAFGAIALLMWWQAGEFKLAAMVMAGTLTTLGLLLLSSRLLVTLLAPLRHHSSSIWRYGLAGLSRQPLLTAVQMSGFGLGILALLLLAIVRIDLLDAWQLSIPEQTPNQFLINIQPHEVADLRSFLHQQGMSSSGLYPMLRARLTGINERPVAADDYASEQARRLINREFNLSWTRHLPTDNRLLAGRWWGQDRALTPQFSVEQGLAERLRIQLGDRLEFDLAGTRIAAKVTSLRQVQWDSFRPNFFVIGTPGLLRTLPTTYITSFYLPVGQEQLISELLRRFPTVTVIDVSAIMRQIRDIIARGSLAVEYVFLFTLIAGVLVLYAGIQSSREHRRRESAILRTLGLGRTKLLLSIGVEFATLGLLAGLLASLCANLTGWLLAKELFAIGYSFNPWLWLTGVAGGALGIGLAGLLASYPLVVQPPLQTLRKE